jgi:uncharacterized protein
MALTWPEPDLTRTAIAEMPDSKSLPLELHILTALAALAFIAGLVRGFAGFGAAMIYVPAASLLVGPQIAVIILWTMDTIPSLPIVMPALKKSAWKAVLPVAAGYATTVGLGVWFLKHGDAELVRWLISGFILATVGVLWSGWRYHGARPSPLSFAVGGVSGLFGGAAQLSGPAVLVYWHAGSDPAWRIRANTIVLFFITTLFSGAALFAAGLFHRPAVTSAVFCAPVYGVGLVLGQRLFGRASEETFRRAALIIILSVAIATLPLFDGILR